MPARGMPWTFGLAPGPRFEAGQVTSSSLHSCMQTTEQPVKASWRRRHVVDVIVLPGSTMTLPGLAPVNPAAAEVRVDACRHRAGVRSFNLHIMLVIWCSTGTAGTVSGQGREAHAGRGPRRGHGLRGVLKHHPSTHAAAPTACLFIYLLLL